jgi:GT2 family glycosyltransferase
VKLGSVVVAWREPGITADALDSLAASDLAVDIPVCVAQELDESGLGAVSRAMPPGGRLIALERNLGFSAAANLGMAAALAEGAEWVLLLNNDATVRRRCLRRCLEEATSLPDVAVVSPAIALAEDPHHLWFAGGRHSAWFAYTRHRGLMGSVGSPGETSDTDYVPGCCALISAAAWEQLGGYREDYFMYYEDVEWCHRARRAGWRVRYLAEVLCLHEVGVSSQQRGNLGLSENTAYYLARNPLRFALESSRPPELVTRTIGILGIWGSYNALRIIRSRQARVASSYLRGLRDAVRGDMGARPTTP